MSACEVLVVGGGPAGSTCAWRLREAGVDVRVLDRRAFPRDKICAGWVTPAVLQSLRLDPAEYARDGRTLQPVTGFLTGPIGGRPVRTDYPGPVSWGIRRREFDAYLLARAGVPVEAPAGLERLERLDGGWLVNGRLRARVVVGAGGHFCPVARQLGAAEGRTETVVAAQEAEFPLDPAQAEATAVQPECPELYFCDDLKGYGWVIRKGDFLNIGLGREDNRRLSSHVRAFVDWLVAAGRIPAGLPARFGGHAYLLYHHAPRPLVADGVVLVGDAAGLAYPQSGEGIRPAVESALLAAETLLAARGDYSTTRLGGYASAMQRRFGPRDTASLADRLPEGLKRFAAHRLLASAWLTRHVVIDRWFLHREQAALGT